MVVQEEETADRSLPEHKARLCCHGGQQQWGMNFYAIYAPVIGWALIGTMLIISNLYNLNSRFIYFVLAYHQAEVESTIYLFSPPGIIISDNGEDYVLKLKENLQEGLEGRGFKQYNPDMCIFKQSGVIIIVYVHDCLKFDITDEGETIDQLISIIVGMERANEHLTPSSLISLLTKDKDGELMKYSWKYRPM
eukprot:5290359-Ditylum_brightwellii.AAC.3